MTTKGTINKGWFLSNYKRTGIGRDAIFGSRKALMEELYATGIPIYCDQSYYAQYDNLYPVIKVGDHFECEAHKEFEEWRDCHYYSLYENAEGQKAWFMTGGRYD